MKSPELLLEKDGTLTGFGRTALAARIKDDLNAACVALYQETEPRNHLGASIVGNECTRKVWYGFRWFRRAVHEARMLRLFNRGHREEERFLAWLHKAGFRVWDVDPNTSKQFRVVACSGHFGGSLDGRGFTPYPELAHIEFLSEFKTHNDNSFKKLKKLGVKLAKAQHYKQMCVYGRAYGFRYSIYLAINKNDDELYVEVVELDATMGDDMTKRGFDVINARTPPSRIAERPDYIDCKMCEFSRQCFYSEPPEVNCRSCRSAYAVDGGDWFCATYQQNIPAHIIGVGCPQYGRLA